MRASRENRAVSDPALPTRKTSLAGVDLDGNKVELSHSISKKLYRCPGCRKSIPIGSDHLLVRVTPASGGPAYHQHWHRDCTKSIVRELRGVISKRL
jgi:hypothetical protein